MMVKSMVMAGTMRVSGNYSLLKMPPRRRYNEDPPYKKIPPILVVDLMVDNVIDHVEETHTESHKII